MCAARHLALDLSGGVRAVTQMASRTFEDPAILDVASSSNVRAAKEQVKVREMKPKELLGNLCYKHSLPADSGLHPAHASRRRFGILSTLPVCLMHALTWEAEHERLPSCFYAYLRGVHHRDEGKEWAAVLSSLHGHHRVLGYLPSSSGEN